MLEVSKKISVPSFRTARINLVFFSGNRGAGKTTSAKYLFDVFDKYNDLRVGYFYFAPALVTPYSLLNQMAYNLGDPFHIIFVDEWKFPNEADFFKGNFLFDVTRIRIERPETEHTAIGISLPSAEKEQLMYNKDSVYNFVIFNDSTIETLYYKLAGVMTYLASKIIRY